MYLITLPADRAGEHRLIFCLADPRAAGYAGPVLERAELEMSPLCETSLFGPASVSVVGRDPKQERRFCLFATARECVSAGYHLVGAMPVVASAWSDELREAVAEILPG